MPKKIICLFIILLITGCAGTITTTKYTDPYHADFKKAYIISSENSGFIKFRFGIYHSYIVVPEFNGPAEKVDPIGNTAEVIQRELENHGIHAVIGKRGDQPADFDLIVEYSDTWRWDVKKILDRLEIVFVSADGDSVLARSVYDIHKYKKTHNFPTPEKEVPKMIRQLLNKNM